MSECDNEVFSNVSLGKQCKNHCSSEHRCIEACASMHDVHPMKYVRSTTRSGKWLEGQVYRYPRCIDILFAYLLARQEAGASKVYAVECSPSNSSSRYNVLRFPQSRFFPRALNNVFGVGPFRRMLTLFHDYLR